MGSGINERTTDFFLGLLLNRIQILLTDTHHRPPEDSGEITKNLRFWFGEVVVDTGRV